MGSSTMILQIIIFCAVSSGILAEIHLNYTEVQKLGNSCPQLDSCGYQRSSGSRELQTIKERNCACDYLCRQYGDCCIDAPSIEVTETLSDFSCYELKQFGGVYMKDTCHPFYDGPDDVKHQCEAAILGDMSDPLGTMPVTDSSTGITYKNYYCSICNYQTDHTVLWTPRLECPTVTLFDSSKNITRDYVLNNIASYGSSWGLYLANDNGSLFFHDCDVDPVMPLHLENKIRLCKPDLISDCPPEWNDSTVKTMCASYMGARFVHGGEKFRNVHCALCNGLNTTHLSCQSAEWRGMVFFRQFESHSFSLLLDVNEGRGQEVGMIKLCKHGEVFDPFFKICRSLACLPGYTREGDECVPRAPDEDNAFSSGSGDIISADPEFVKLNSEVDTQHLSAKYGSIHDVPESNYSALDNGKSHNLSSIRLNNSLDPEISKLQNCLLISLTSEDYVVLPDDSIYVPKYNKKYEPTTYHAADGSVLICSHLTVESDVKFMPLMGYITTTGLSVSMVCLFLHLIIFCLVPDLQKLSGKNLASQCVALLSAYACFLIGSFDSLGFEACTAISFLTYYFFLVTFSWMVVMAFDVWRSLKMATSELRVINGRQVKRFILYSVFTWVIPLCIVLTAALAEYTDLFPLQYRPGFASPRCWFKRRRPLLIFFVLPLVAIMIANAALFVSSARMILQTTQTTLKQQSQSQKRSFKLYLRLALLMGLTWISGLVASFADIQAFWYLFVILNTLQGLFIFIAFSCTSKVFNYFKAKCSKSTDFKSTSQSASTGSTSTLHSNFTKKLSSKFLLRNKPSNSPRPGKVPPHF